MFEVFGDTFWLFDTKQSQEQKLYMMYLILNPCAFPPCTRLSFPSSAGSWKRGATHNLLSWYLLRKNSWGVIPLRQFLCRKGTSWRSPLTSLQPPQAHRWLVDFSTHPRTGQLVLAIAQSSDGGMKCFDTLVKVKNACFFLGKFLLGISI